MLTYIDQFTRAVGEELGPSFSTILRSIGGKINSDLDVVRIIIEGFIAKKSQYAMILSKHGLSSKAAMSVGSVAMMGQPIFKQQSNIKPLCIQLTSELATDFQGAIAPETNDFMEIVHDRGVVYIDIPPGVYNWFGNTSVRAIFITSERLYDSNNIMVVLSQGDRVSLENQFEFAYTIEDPEGTVAGNIDMKTTDGVMRMMHLLGEDREGEFRSWHEQISDLVKLAILYWFSETTRSGGMRFQEIPHIPEKDLLKTSRRDKQRSKLHNASLFKIVKLTSPKDRFGRTDQELKPRDGWTLGVRTTVRGHFRWQACGSKWSEHKLIYIASHERGPQDGIRRNEMFQLEPKPKPISMEES